MLASRLALAGICSLALLVACGARLHPKGGGKGAQAALDAAGIDVEQVQAGGRQRNYLIHIPTGYRGEPVPLVFVFHGGGGKAPGIAKTTEYTAVADRENFIVVFPNGTGQGGGNNGGYWNAGSGRGEGPAEKANVDDVGFVRAMLDQIEGKYAVDKRRIYATGLSKGGMFSYLLACRMSDTFAAVGIVSATMTAPDCAPSNPVAILHIHGTADENVPINGGAGDLSRDDANYEPVAKVMEFWRTRDKCSAQTTEKSEAPDTKCYSYTECAGADVKYCVIQGEGHGWPGAAKLAKWQEQNNVYITQDFSATEETWAWFKAHPKP